MPAPTLTVALGYQQPPEHRPTGQTMDKAMNENIKNTIKTSHGSHAVFLALRHDIKLKGRYSSSAAGILYIGEKKLGKPGMAELLVYLTGQYGLTPSEFELYSGILAAVPRAESKEVEQARKVEPEVLEMLTNRLRRRHIGVTGAIILGEFDIEEELGHDWTGRAGDMRIANALESIGWKRRRSMVRGVRQYRWYPPKGWIFSKDAELEMLTLDDTIDEKDIDVDNDPWADEGFIFEDDTPVPAHADDSSHLQVVETAEE
jgi:hypothetical protein